MRAYFFTNMYLSSIQQGIQPLHCIVEMMNTSWPSHIAEIVDDWATNHKTVVCLNGGAAGDILETYERIEKFGSELNLPYGSFCEDDWSLSGTMTTCGIIVPEPIYVLSKQLRDVGSSSSSAFSHLFNSVERDLAKFLNDFRLAS